MNHLPRRPLSSSALGSIAGALLGSIVVAAAALVPNTAHASGFSVARFGGAHGNPTETNASTVYYNPAGFASAVGTQIMLDVNWAYRTASYDRPASAVDGRQNGIEVDPPTDLDIQANSGKGTVKNFLYSPMFGITNDMGKVPLSIGFAFSAPFGGVSDWESSAAVEGASGAFDGPNRWFVTEGTIRTLAFSLALAYEIKPIRLSVGVAGNLYMSEIDTIRARTVPGTDDIQQEGRSLISVKSIDPGLGVGLLWEPIDEKLWVGLSYQSAPGFDGKQILRGDLTNVFPPNDDQPDDVVVTSQLPDVIRFGVRGRPLENLELRLSGDVTRWSRLENQCIIDEANGEVEDPYATCAVTSTGALTDAAAADPQSPSIIQNLGRNWKDAAGVRLGASYWLKGAPVELFVDVGYDGNAVPDEALEPALMDFNKVGVGVGGRFVITKNIAASVLLSDFIYFKRDTTGNDTASALLAPSRQPSSAGVYTQNVAVLNTNFEFFFGQGGGKRNRQAEPTVEPTEEGAAAPEAAEPVVTAQQTATAAE